MALLNKLTDLIKEVFWLKKSPAKKRTAKKTLKPPVKVKPVKVPKAPKPPKPVKLPKVKVSVIDPNLVKAGEITHYFDRIKVCVVKITNGTVLIGDKVTIIGAKQKFVQKLWSMQIESVDVKVAKKGQLIGIKIDKPVGPGYVVFK